MWWRLIAGTFITLASVNAVAEETIKVGLILPMTGPFTTTGKQVEAGARFYMQQNGASVDGKKIELILRDDAGIVAKRQTDQQCPKQLRSLRSKLELLEAANLRGGLFFLVLVLGLDLLLLLGDRRHQSLNGGGFRLAPSLVETKTLLSQLGRPALPQSKLCAPLSGILVQGVGILPPWHVSWPPLVCTLHDRT
jgi:hypothetical protein